MNKKILISVPAVLVIIIVGVFCGIKLANKPKQLELTYEKNAGIPFKWGFEIEDESIAKFVKSYVVKDENTNGKVGASVYTNYVFKGLKEGKTNITFKFVNITDETVEKEETHTVKVDKNKNISIVVMDE